VRLCGETGEVTRILRQLQTIRLGSIHLKNEGLQILQQITKVPADLNAQLAQLKLLHLFAARPPGPKTPSQHSRSPKKIAPLVFIGFSGREEGKSG
jgi:hypothetical protein